MMAESFLRLELDNFGIKAQISEHGRKQNLTENRCHILFKDMPDEKSASNDNADAFEAGMDIVATKLDLELCSKAIIFISDRLISFKTLELPFKSEKKIKQILPLELEAHLVFNNKAYISDFHMLDFSNGQENSNLILSASVTQSLIENYFLKLQKIGITPLIIAPLGYAAAIGFLLETSQSKEIVKFSDFAFLHATDHTITLVLVKKRIPCAIRTIKNFNISSDSLAVMVEQTIIGFNQRTGQETDFYIYLCTDDNIHNFDQIANAFSPDLKHQSLREVKLNSTKLLSNVSLETKEKYLFNFCKGKYGTSSFFKTYFTNIAVSLVLLFCLIAISVTSAAFDNRKLKNKIADIDNRAFALFKETFPQKTKIHDPYMQMEANIKSYLKNSKTGVNGGKSNREIEFAIVQILGELSKKIADSTNIDISRFLFSKDRLILSGNTDNFNNVEQIKSTIESSQFFKTVKISSASADKKSNRVNFKFIIEM